MNLSKTCRAIDDIVADLDEPISAMEKSEGWTGALKNRWRDWFIQLKEKVETGQPTPAGWGIVRAMDFDGIDGSKGGGLSRQASHIGALLGGKIL